ncbi:Permease family [Fragilaria crotonensis]|nr:Permease family [Fragilaria crotonensis]
MAAIIASINSSVQSSFVGRFFKMEERGTNFFTELNGACSTFMSMAYILAVNPRILSESGGPCVPPDGAIFDPTYSQCIEDVKREYITSTAIGSMFGCLCMGLLANLPVALAPGMGMNAYFTYSVVGFRGTGAISYQAAVTAVMIEGSIFLVLALTGIRYAIIKLIPEPVKTATPAAIGAFLAHLGLQTAEGIGVVVSDIATAVTLGGCPEDKRTNLVAFTDACQADVNACVVSDSYTCDELGGVMSSPTTWVGILGLLMMSIMIAYKHRAAFVVGIGFVTFISWFRGTAITYFPYTEAGDNRFAYFKQVVAIEPINQILVPFTSDLGPVAVALITFLYVDFLDTTGTLFAIASSMGYVDEKGDFPRSKLAFASDALATMFGSLFGLSPVTCYVESGAGVEAGSRTGLTAVFCGFFFFLSLFFAPIIASIPPWASGGALIIVGSLMARALKDIKWHNPTHALTAFLTVIVMPLTYSIAYGLIAGMITFFVSEGIFLLLSYVGIPKPDYGDEPPLPPVDTTSKKTETREGGTDEPEEAPADYTEGTATERKDKDDEVDV